MKDKKKVNGKYSVSREISGKMAEEVTLRGISKPALVEEILTKRFAPKDKK